MEGIIGLLVPGTLAFAGVALTALLARRGKTGDERLQFIAVLQAERATADARADRAEAKLGRAEARARRWETFAWTCHRLLLRSGVDAPEWPTDESTKVPA